MRGYGRTEHSVCADGCVYPLSMTVFTDADGNNSLRVAVTRLVYVEAQVGRLLNEAEAEQPDDLESVIPIHRNLHVAERLQLCQVFGLLERLRVERRIRRLGDRISPQCTDAVQRTCKVILVNDLSHIGEESRAPCARIEMSPLGAHRVISETACMTTSDA